MQQAILQAIYAVFLGGVMTAFVAVGLFTFYPQPTTYQSQIEQLDSRENAIYSDCKASTCVTTPAEDAELKQIQTERQALVKKADAEQQDWNRVAGIMMIGIATVLLAVSLVRWDRAIVISNGLLLGGLFTMVFGIGLTLAGGDDVLRFVVLAIALAITVVLGYLRFAKSPKRPSEPATAADTSEIAERVDVLEGQFEALRRALGP